MPKSKVCRISVIVVLWMAGSLNTAMSASPPKISANATPATSPASQPASVSATMTALGTRLDQILRICDEADGTTGADGSMSRNDRSRTTSAVAQVRTHLQNSDLRAAKSVAQNAPMSVQNADIRLLWNEVGRLLDIAISDMRTNLPRQVDDEMRALRGMVKPDMTILDLREISGSLAVVTDKVRKLQSSAEGYSSSNNSLHSQSEQLRNWTQEVDSWIRVMSMEERGELGAVAQQLATMSTTERYSFNASSSALIPRDYAARRLERLNQEIANRLEAILREAGERVVASKGPEEIQKISDEVQRKAKSIYPSSSYNNAEATEATARVKRALATMDWWARVLAAQLSGRPRQALSALGAVPHAPSGSYSASSTQHDYTIIPRQAADKKRTDLQTLIMNESREIAEPDLKRIVDVVEQAKSLDDLLDLNRRLGTNWEQTLLPMFDNMTIRQELQSFAIDVQRLNKLKQCLEGRQFKAFWQVYVPSTRLRGVPGVPLYTGNPAMPRSAMYPVTVEASMPPAPRHRWTERTTQQAMVLANEALAQSMDLGQLPPNIKSMPCDQAMLAIADQAIKAQDFVRLLQALEAYQQAVYGETPEENGMPNWLAADIGGTRDFIAGENFKQAGQTREAAKMYLLVLRQAGRRVPVTVAGQRLDQLRKADPAGVNAAAEDLRNMPPPSSSAKPGGTSSEDSLPPAAISPVEAAPSARIRPLGHTKTPTQQNEAVEPQAAPE